MFEHKNEFDKQLFFRDLHPLVLACLRPPVPFAAPMHSCLSPFRIVGSSAFLLLMSQHTLQVCWLSRNKVALS